MAINIHEHKRYYYTFDNSLFTESIQNTTQIFPRQIITSGFSSVSAPGRWHNAIRVRAKPCVHRFTIPGHSRREVPRRGLWT